MKKHIYHIPIRIQGLADGEHEFDLTAKPSEIQLPEEFASDIAVSVHLEKTHAHIIVRVKLETTAVYQCDRCLNPVQIPVRESFMIFYARDLAAARLLDKDDVRIIDPNESCIDIGDDTRDYALLSIPMRHTCGEDEEGNPLCKTLYPTDAEEEESDIVDPRWEKLRNLKK